MHSRLAVRHARRALTPTIALLYLWLLQLLAQPARAEVDDDAWSARGTLDLALMVSSDQIRQLKYDKLGLVGSLYGGYALWPALELRAGLLGGPFFASQGGTGGLFAGCVGPRLLVPGRRLRPYVALDVGAAITGKLVRPYLGGNVGVDVAINDRMMVGPSLGFGNVFQWNGANYSSDATYFTVGASLWIKYGKPRPPPPPPQPPPPIVIIERTPAPPAEPAEDVLLLIERALPSPSQRVEMLAPVLFAFDSDALEPLGIAMLHEVAGTLETRSDIELVQIQGYADGRGEQSYNEALSQRRAERVRDWLVEHGIAPERLTIDPHGATSFVEEGSEESAHTQNRRVVFRVLRAGEP